MKVSFLDTYHSLKAPAKASLWFLVCGFLQKGISFITTPLFTRIMTENEYGRYSVYSSWFSIVQIIVSLNLAAGVYTRGLVKNDTAQDEFSSSMLGLSTTCILLWTLIYAAFHNLFNSWLDMSTVLMVTMFVEVWATSAYQFWSNKERANYRYKQLVVLTLAYTVLRPVVGLISVLNVPNTHQVEARVIATTSVNVLLFLWLYISIMKRGHRFFDKEYWLYALKFNIPLVPHYLSQIVLGQSDRIMINNICGSAEAAYYSVAYMLSMVLQILSSSISSTMNPWIYRKLEHRQEDRIRKTSYGVLLIVALSNIMVIAVAPEILKIMAPENYGSAVWVVPPVTASVYFMFLYNLFATFEYFYEKTHYVMIASITGAIVNIMLNAILIPRYGYLAAGYTTLACYILYACAHYYFMKKVVKENMEGKRIYEPRVVLGVGFALLLCAMILMAIYEFPIYRYFLLTLCLLIIFCKRKVIQKEIQILRGKENENVPG